MQKESRGFNPLQLSAIKEGMYIQVKTDNGYVAGRVADIAENEIILDQSTLYHACLKVILKSDIRKVTDHIDRSEQ